MATAATRTYVGQGIEPIYGRERALNLPISLPASSSFVAGTCMGFVAGSGTAVNHQQTITITGTPTGGTFRLLYGGQLTAAIAYNASAATVKTALEALSNIGSGNLTASGGALPGTAVVITFSGSTVGGLYHPVMTAISSLTGGTNPAIAITQTTVGKPALGYHDAYNDANSDGTEVGRCILQYPCATDSEGKITFGTTAGTADQGNTERSAPAWFKGEFKTSELTGIDAAFVTDVGRLITGSTTLTDTTTVLSMGK